MTPLNGVETTVRTLDGLDRLLAFLVVFFTVLMILISKWSPNDGQTFQVLSGGFTGCLGALLARMTPKKPTAETKGATQ